jgi:hypothetical protein
VLEVLGSDHRAVRAPVEVRARCERHRGRLTTSWSRNVLISGYRKRDVFCS